SRTVSFFQSCLPERRDLERGRASPDVRGMSPRSAVARAKIDKQPAATSTASVLACVGVCSYLIGLASPISPGFDLPLVVLIVLATLAAVAGVKQPTLARSFVLVPVVAFAAARLASSLAAADAARGLQVLAPLLPGLLLFFVLSEWIDRPGHL